MIEEFVRALCERVASRLPVKHLGRNTESQEGEYLSRYTVFEWASDWKLYLHHFHRDDADQELHNHPWLVGVSFILTGGYLEERRVPKKIYTEDEAERNLQYRVRLSQCRPGSLNFIFPHTHHRVEMLDEENGCWTLFLAGPKEQSWGFWNRHTGVFKGWRTFIQEKSYG